MKKTFWLLVFLSVSIPLLVLSFGGGYFFYKHKSKEKKQYLKSSLKKDSLRLSKKVDKLLLLLSQQVEQIAIERIFPEQSFFSAVVIKDNEEDYEILIPSSEDQTLEETQISFLKKLINHLHEIPPRKKSRFQVLSLQGKKTETIAVAFIPLSFSKDSETIGFINYKQFKKRISLLLDFNNKEAREVLLLTGQGWPLFHTNPNKLLKKLSPLSLLWKAVEKSKNQPGFVKWEKNNQMNLSYVLPHKEENLFIAARAAFKTPLFAWMEWEWRWFALCLIFLGFMLSALFLILSPLFSAYNQLKKALSRYGLKGELPLIISSNPLLNFYPDMKEAIEKRDIEREISALSPSKNKSPTFKQVLEGECEKLKRRYPGFSIHQSLKANVPLWQFAPFMKKILSALLLNGIEAMGGNHRQNITVKSFGEKNHFVFTVEDKGPGLTEEEAEQAFSLYYSTKSQLGAGLNLVEAIVTANNGNIKLLPGGKGGTQARVSLPLSCFLKAQNFKSLTLTPGEKPKDPTMAELFRSFIAKNTDERQHPKGDLTH